MTKEELKKENKRLKEQATSMTEKLESALGTVAHQNLLITKLKLMIFGKRSEKREPMPDHPWLFPEPAKKPATEEKSVDIAAHTRKTKKRFAEEK